jgi:PTS system nitrogen regulatory IIA component
MKMKDLIDEASIMLALDARNKQDLLTKLSAAAADRFDLDKDDIFDVLWEREGLGSTGYGGGVAVPHGRVKGVTVPLLLLARLARPVDYEAADGLPVDVVFLLLAAESAGADHLEALQTIACIARDSGKMKQIRACKKTQEVYKLFK